jgi:hypothetical protein
MYQHPATLELMASYRQSEMLHEAENEHLARLARPTGSGRVQPILKHRLTAAAVTVLVTLGVIAIF